MHENYSAKATSYEFAKGTPLYTTTLKGHEFLTGYRVVLGDILYFFARLLHFAVYTVGVPVVRTLAFVAGFIAQVTIALAIFAVL